MCYCAYTNNMSSVIEDFFVRPSEALLESCTKEQLVQIAERFSVDLTSQEKRLKETIVTTLKRSLVDRGVIEVSTELITPSESFVRQNFQNCLCKRSNCV